MDLKQSLDALKPALVGGYNKDAVYNLMEQLLTECREESLKEISELKAENSRLEAEHRGYKEKNELMTGQFEELSKSMQKMTTAMEKESDYKQKRDKELEGFYRKEEELNNSLSQVREEAEKEKARILEEAEQERKKLLEQAQNERTNILKYAEEEKSSLLQDAKEELGQLLERSARIRKNLEEWKCRVNELFAWSDNNLEVKSEENQAAELLTSLETQQREAIEEEDAMDSGMMNGTDES